MRDNNRQEKKKTHDQLVHIPLAVAVITAGSDAADEQQRQATASARRLSRGVGSERPLQLLLRRGQEALPVGQERARCEHCEEGERESW